MKKCLKCGGSGDMFALQPRSGKCSIETVRIENWEWYQANKKEWILIGDRWCSLCNGLGKVER